MGKRETYLLFVERLNAAGAPYMVSGSIALGVYGEPRLTMDIDVVLDVTVETVGRLTDYFPQEEFYMPPLDVLKIESRRDMRGHFNIIHLASGFKADIYPAGRDPFHAWALARVKTYTMQGVQMPLAPIEYAIIRKLEYYREGSSDKHLRDINSMVLASAAMIDFAVLESLVEERGLAKEWGKAK